MAFSNEEGDNTCPLCLSEMDETDLQLKPCKCGYEICVLCWHHVMEVDPEGRCPACRTPYDKDRIVEKAAHLQRRMDTSERKHRSQKSKAKTSESRKHLSSVRVIQRNLVYISGIPSHLADEEILERREFFGQYGKILKVSISRSNSSSQQSSSCPSTNVYITYTKEEEALRCIQAVNGFILDGKPLRACFGTTKYCHAWLKNMPCNNPECLYLHEMGVPEDSFTKEEMVSSCLSKAQQFHIPSNSSRRSGNFLPPPETDTSSITNSSSSNKMLSKVATPNFGSQTKSNAMNGTTGKSTVLPPAASWGQRSGQGKSLPPKTPPTAMSTLLKSSSSQVLSASPPSNFATSAAMVNISPSSVSAVNANNSKQQPRCVETPKHNRTKTSQTINPSTTLSEDFDIVASSNSVKGLSRQNSPESRSGDRSISHCDGFNGSKSKAPEVLLPSSGHSDSLRDKEHVKRYDKRQEKGTVASPKEICEDNVSVNSNTILSQFKPLHVEEDHDPEIPISKSLDAIHMESSQESSSKEVEISSKDEASSHEHAFPVSSSNDRLGYGGPNFDVGSCGIDSNDHRPGLADDKGPCSNLLKVNGTKSYASLEDTNSSLKAGPSNITSNSKDDPKLRSSKSMDFQSSGDDGRNIVDSNIPESSIISDILSMNLDSCSQDLLKVLCGNKDSKACVNDFSSTRKSHTNGQSRFSFAREEEPGVESTSFPSSNGIHEKLQNVQLDANPQECRNQIFDFNKTINSDFCKNQTESNFASNMAASTLLDKTGAHPRPHVSAPPGFSVPTRTSSIPPPGFSPHAKVDRMYDWTKGSVQSNGGSVNQDASLLSPNTYSNSFSSLHQYGANGSSNDLEFIDPAIMAVGRGKLPTEQIQSPHINYYSMFGGPMQDLFGYKSNFLGQARSSDYDARLQMQNQKPSPYVNPNDSVPSLRQQLKLEDQVEAFAAFLDGMPSSRLREQAQRSFDSSLSHLSFQQQIDPTSRSSAAGLNGWNGWNRITSALESSFSGRKLETNLNQIAYKERLGLLNGENGLVFSNYDDTKLHISPSEDYYRRQFEL